LSQRPAIVVGGGKIAAGKVVGLLAAGAAVTVIAPELTPALEQLAADESITHHRRPYAPGDLAGAQLAICATNDRAVNAAVWAEANARGVWVNVVDDPPHCSFIAPSIARRGDLTVAVSTGGKAPALAVRLRQQIEALLGDEHARFLELAGQLRQPLAERYPSFEERKRRWYDLVDSDVLDLLRAGDEAGAYDRIAALMGVALERPATRLD
jgi:uroporphyrin-III C-methyltransferase/precorrin-2 dehydrogenase/sirohydrochlorin ferrochelatase/precorrin-2 dehydrogenase/sirohydrochlorin ferrochelatase